MALLTASEYFNSFPQATQNEIRASWGGSDRLNEWYQGAVNAGAVPEKGGVTPPSPGKGGFDFPTFLRNLAKQQGWSEDFGRFSDDQLREWEKYFDYKSNRFRSEHADMTDQDPEFGKSVYDKPTDLPPGWSIHGTQIIRTKDLPSWAEGSGQTPPGVTPVTPVTAAPSALQQGLVEAFKGREGIFGSPEYAGDPKTLKATSLPSGGLMWTGGSDLASLLPAALRPVGTGASGLETVGTIASTQPPATRPAVTQASQVRRAPEPTPGLIVPLPTTVAPPVAAPTTPAITQPVDSSLQQALIRKKYPFANAYRQPGTWWA